jgi:hypothetical protein
VKKIFSSILALTLCLSMTLMTTACNTDQVLADVDVVIQIASSIGSAVGNVSPADAALIAKFSGIAQSGISAIQATYKTYEKSGAVGDLQKLQAAIAAVQENLNQELQAARISDPAAQDKVVNWVALVQSSVAAIAAALPEFNEKTGAIYGSVAFVNVSKKMWTASSLPTPEELQERWAREVCKADVKCAKKVKAHRSKIWRGFKAFGSSLGNAIGEAKFGG